MVEVRDGQLRRINIPVPNPALTEWLMGSECKAAVTEVTTEIFVAYRNTLPTRTERLTRSPRPGHLRRSSYMDVRQGGWGTDQDRWFGYVGNDAEYAAVIEYGNRRRGIPGQGQLREAAHLVAGGLGEAGGINIPGISRDARGRLRGSGGRFVRNPLNKDK